MGTAVVSGCYAPPVLDASEDIFDLVSLAVEVFVIGKLDLTVAHRRDARIDTALDEGVAETVAVIASVADQHLGPWQAG